MILDHFMLKRQLIEDNRQLAQDKRLLEAELEDARNDLEKANNRLAEFEWVDGRYHPKVQVGPGLQATDDGSLVSVDAQELVEMAINTGRVAEQVEDVITGKKILKANAVPVIRVVDDSNVLETGFTSIGRNSLKTLTNKIWYARDEGAWQKEQ